MIQELNRYSKISARFFFFLFSYIFIIIYIGRIFYRRDISPDTV